MTSPSTLLLGSLIALSSAPFLLQEESPELTQEALEKMTEGIKAEVEQMRGEKFKRPVAVSVTDEEGLVRYMQKRLDASTTPEELKAGEEVAKLIGLIPPDLDYMAVMTGLIEEQVGGFYDPDGEKFFLMERFTGGLASVILSHELTHALDDQLYDIDGTLDRLKGNADAQWAYQAVVEGSGTILMNQWTIAHMSELSMAELAGGMDIGGEAMESAPPFLWKPLLGAYMRGAAFLARTDSVMEGQAASLVPDDIHRAFTEVPASSEQILHPEKYWDAEKRDDPIPVRFGKGELPQGWTVLQEETLGELMLALAVQPPKKRKGMSAMSALITKYTSDAASGWGGDRCALLGNGNARFLVLHTTWDTEADAIEFEEALDELSDFIGERVGGFAKALGSSEAEFSFERTGSDVRVVARAGVDAAEAKRVHDAVGFHVEREANR